MILVPITEDSHGVAIEMMYATADNFTGKPVYARGDCWLRPEAATLLATAVDLAARQGLRLRVHDAFRPAEAQWALWNHTPDPEFLADPRRGSPHSRGVAVDVSLERQDGTRLDFGTVVDAFTPQSHHGDTTISAEAQLNRHILMGIMTTAGWDFYRNEWWHYQMFDARARFPVLSDSILPQPMMPPGP